MRPSMTDPLPYNVEPDADFYDRAMAARLNASWILQKWGVDNGGSYDLLAKLLGYVDERDFNIRAEMTKADIGLCALLCGPHGWAIYKMLLVKRGMVTHD